MESTRSVYLDAQGPLAFAHRGGANVPQNLGVENSLAAFRHAVDLGYRYLETDVRCTKDGVAYACHDERLDRLLGRDEAIADLTSADIDAALLGDREPIVRFDVLLDALPEARFNIDVKSDDAVEPTAAVLERASATPRVCLASFSHSRLRTIRRRLPHVVTSASTLEAARLRLGLPVPREPFIYQVPVTHGRVTVVNRAFVDRVHRAGRQVHVWTIDEPDEMHRLLDLGVDGIMTDRTDLLKDVLISRGQWKDQR